jgi:hypothetical protein
MSSLPKNIFYDINKLPKEYGILVFPISIARAEHKNGQSPLECMEYIKYFSPSKVSAPKIGLNIIYGDFLYFHSKKPAAELKNKFMGVALNHRRAFQKLLQKEWNRFQIQQAFSYEVWNQLYVDYDGDFVSDLYKIKALYKKDKQFQKYIKEDAKFYHKKLTEEQVNFFLEEHLMFYLLSKGKIHLPNQHVQGREQWILWCYPGVPLKAQIYLYQSNPLRFNNPKNIYENSTYDLESKKLIDFTRIDLETYDYKYD